MLGKFIEHKEDSLTAAIFTHLLHLPIETCWNINPREAMKSFLNSGVCEFPGELKDRKFVSIAVGLEHLITAEKADTLISKLRMLAPSNFGLQPETSTSNHLIR